MYYDLNQFEDPKLISFFLDNLKPGPSTYFEEYGDRKTTKNYFYHMHDMVNIMKPPKKGSEKNISRNGIPKMHIFGNAIPTAKHVHAAYCRGLHPRSHHKNGVITHPMGEKILFYQGQEVIARWDIFGVFYSGVIDDIVDTKVADVKFYNGHKLIDVPYSDIIAVKRRKIKVGDYVMANVLDEFDKDCWVPGIVTFIDYDTEPITYHIAFYNGEKGVNIYIQLIKISHEKYLSIKDYILKLLINKQEVVDDTVSYEMVDLEENVELFIFGREYKELRGKYQPLLQPTYNYLPLITIPSNEFINLRKSLPSLKSGDEVLAKWPDDCLYYPSVVKEYLGDYKYKVENNLRAVKVVPREDLILKSSNYINRITIGDTILAEHPKFKFAFAPGEVRRLDKNQNKFIVRFYDFSENLISEKELYQISKEKFESDINSVIKLENAWIGHEVLTFNFYNKLYEWGRIVRRIVNHRQFVIEWPDGRQSIHCAYFLFVPKNKNYDNFGQNRILPFEETRSVRFTDNNDVSSKFVKATDFRDFINEGYDVKITKIKSKESRRAKSYSFLDRDRETPIIDVSELDSGQYLD